MSYSNAGKILPPELLRLIQEHVDGEYIYIPRKTSQKKAWGSNTPFRYEMKCRNRNIYADYLQGHTTTELAKKYYLSVKSIQRIVLTERKQ